MAQIHKHSLRALGLIVAGAAGTVTLLGPASAAQASGVNWDAVAKCESGNNWSIDTGNGYYGGLQFSRSTWQAHGGGKYANTANKASRSEQIRIAEKVLDSQGIGAWPVCGRKAGSTKSYQAKNAGGSSSGKSHEKSGSSRSTSHEKSSSSRSTSHRTAAKVTRSTSAEATGRHYTVRSGDTLAKIAAAQHVKGGWRALYQLNHAKLGGDPNLIFPGQRLSL